MHHVTFRNPFKRTSESLHTVGIIPARYQSTRFPGKPLVDIAGRPMIEHVYRRTAAAPGVDAVVVATDDVRIANAVESFGGNVRLTSPHHRSGLDRVAELAQDLSCDIVVNIQGDEPLIEPEMIGEVVDALDRDPSVHMSTLRHRITDAADLVNPHIVKVVVDLEENALYFSRAPLPSSRGAAGTASGYKHVGLYAYRLPFLLTLAALPQSPLEIAESLEQLRALEHGYRIRASETRFDSVGVDTPDDLDRVRQQIAVGPTA